MKVVMPHASRPLCPWLIFDVRPKCRTKEKTFSFKSLRHLRSWVSGDCFCIRVRGLATLLTPRGKFQIKSIRHSGERVIARVVQDCVAALPCLLFPSMRTRSLPRVSRFSSIRSSKFQPCRTRRQSQRRDLSRCVHSHDDRIETTDC
jgi:hypothetical protein